MRVTSVDMYSAASEEAISFNLSGNVSNEQYEARQILGLDAQEIVPKFYGAGADGSKFYEYGMKPRDVVIRVILKPRFELNETYGDVRDRLYRAISANRTGLVTLNFNAGATIVACISGSITKFEAGHFTKTPEVQITVNCKDPMFKGLTPTIFEEAELTTTNPLKIPDSRSSAPHGFKSEIKFTAPEDQLTIMDAEIDPTWVFMVVPDGGFLTDDILYFSSEYSNKYVYLTRGATTVQLADKIYPGSIWPIVFPGSNEFYIDEMNNVDVQKVEYTASYWGV